ncbi:MAG: kinase, partial [Gammaproteobacteria bacterium]
MDGNALNESTQAFLLRHDLKKAFFEQAQRYFDPLLDVLLWQRSQSGAALIVGVNGAQGSGKSTVCDYWVARCLSVKGVNACCVSIDDFYFDRAKRRRLAEEVHPLLATRGVPGTHDVDAAQAFLDAVRDQRVPLSVPRFDKSTDDPFPASMWP